MSTCARCIFNPFCQSPGPACSSFKDKDRYADRNEIIREFAERLHEKLYGFPTVYNASFGRMIDTLVKEMTEEQTNESQST